jgi:sugar/nucleoside kinase (ribokinase family)
VAPSRSPVGSPVGAGDAFLAALRIAIGEGRPPAAALAAAAGAGAAVLAAHGATMIEAGGARALARLVRVTPLQEG